MGMFFYLKFQKQYKQVKRIFLYTSYIFIMVPATPGKKKVFSVKVRGKPFCTHVFLSKPSKIGRVLAARGETFLVPFFWNN